MHWSLAIVQLRQRLIRLVTTILVLIGSVAIQVVEQVAQAVASKRDAPLLGAFACQGEHAMLAVKVRDAQPAQLGDADACVVEQPQDRPVAHGGPFGDRAGFMGEVQARSSRINSSASMV